MGVPKFFRYISERYPCLGELIKDYQIPEFDNLYLDMNGIIHVCSHPNDFDPHFRISDEKIFSDIFHYLELLFGMIKPKKLFFMAVDGVAPRAKMNQQRGRRFRSAKEAEMLEKRATDMGQKLPESARFDSNCITPGTVFMVKLQEQLKYFITRKISEDPLWQKCTVILSGHETPGEGEHKIMDYIRYMKSQPDYDPTTRHCLYGLDADLIMLGLCSHEPHFSLLREEVKFGRQAKRQTASQGVRFFLLHLSLMREYLDLEFDSLKRTLPFPYDLESVIDDWVLLSFLVGNDFIPNVPDMHISSGALPMLYKTYKDVLPTLDGYINEQGTLNLARFRKLMEKLAAFDISQFKETYADLKYFEAKTGRKMNSKLKPFEMDGDDDNADKDQSSKPNASKNRELADLIKATDDLYNDDAIEEEEEDVFQQAEYDFGDDSEEDDPQAFITEFHQHKRNYYVEKMEYDKVTADVLSGQAEGYVRAIQWNLHYYYNGVASWSWFYPHHYAPYLSDICRFKDIDLNFDLGKPFHPFEQLLGVLPAASKSLLPEAYRGLMVQPTSPIIEYYPEDFRTDLNGKAQEWEAVVLIPFISEGRLLEAMAPCYEKLSADEKARNKFGPMLIYNYTNNSSGEYKSPEFFPAVMNNLTKVDQLWYNDVQLEKSKLVKGLLPGARTDVYFPGFPTLQHIPFVVKLKKANVAVFETLNRNESMILTFTDFWLEAPPDLSDVAKEYIGKDVYVNYPHLHEARIIAVADKKNRFDLNNDPKAPQSYTKSVLEEMASYQVEAEASTITNEYIRRRGIDIGETQVVVYALPMEGKKGVLKNGELSFEKQFVSTPMQYALQTIVKDIEVFEPKEDKVTVDDIFAPGSSCFMLAQPYYGSCGKVLEAKDIKPGRIQVEMVSREQPDFSEVRRKLASNNIYYAANQAAQHIGMNTLLLTRITGTVLLKSGGKDSKESQHNIGLNLKSSKQNLMVPGFTRRNNGVWLYSTLVLQDLELYMDKFPEVFEEMSRSVGTDLKLEDVFPGPDGSKKVTAIKKFFNELPCSKVERASCDSDILPWAIVEETEKTVDTYLKSDPPNKTGTLQVKPSTLYKSQLFSGNLSPDPKAEHFLFDRIVVVRDDFIVPMGLKGTIIGIHKAEMVGDNRYDVLFDETFPGAVSISNSSKRAYRITQSKFINITFGMRQACKNSVPQGRVFSANEVKSKSPSAFTSLNSNKQQNTITTIPVHNWRHGCLRDDIQTPRSGPGQKKKSIFSRDPHSNPLLRGPEWFTFPSSSKPQAAPEPDSNKYPDVWAQLQVSKSSPNSTTTEPKQFTGPPPASALPIPPSVPMAIQKDKLPLNEVEDCTYRPPSIRIAKKTDDDQMSNALKQMLRISGSSKGSTKLPHSNAKPVLVSDMMAKAAAEAAASCSTSSSRRDSLRLNKKRQGTPQVQQAQQEHQVQQAQQEQQVQQAQQEQQVQQAQQEQQVQQAQQEQQAQQVQQAQQEQQAQQVQQAQQEQQAQRSSAPAQEPSSSSLAKSTALNVNELLSYFQTKGTGTSKFDFTESDGNQVRADGTLPDRRRVPSGVCENKQEGSNWRGPPRSVLLQPSRPPAQRYGPVPLHVQKQLDELNNVLRGRPSKTPRFGSTNLPFGPPSNWQQVRPFQHAQYQQQNWQVQQQHWQQYQWQQSQWHHQQHQQQQQQHQQQQKQQQKQLPSENTEAPKRTDGITFVPLQAVKQQRNAKSAALLRREHLSSQEPTPGQDKSPSKQAEEMEGSQLRGTEAKEQLPKNGMNAGTQFVSTDRELRTSPKKTESQDKKADVPSRPVSQVRRSRLAAKFGPTDT